MTTVTISSTDIEDTSLWSDRPTYNYGTSNQIYLNPAPRNGLIRLLTASIPAGTITAARMYFKTSLTGGTFSFYVVEAANDWIEGTHNNAQGIGEPCWNHCKADTQNWAGSDGCNTSGVDYIADASPPAVTTIYTTANFNVISLTPSWFTAWRDGTQVNNGMLIKTADVFNYSIYSSEHATVAYRPYFEIDYTEPTSSNPKIIFFRLNF